MKICEDRYNFGVGIVWSLKHDPLTVGLQILENISLDNRNNKLDLKVNIIYSNSLFLDA